MSIFFLTIVVALIGGYIGVKLKIPAGAMMGSLIAVALLNLFGSAVAFPSSYKTITQISTGAFIGARISKKDILGLREIIKPAFLVIGCMTVMNFIMGYFLHRHTGMDIATAMFASAPGGMMDMTLIAYELKADTAKVVVLQLVRLLSVIGIIPAILKFLIKNRGLEKIENEILEEELKEDKKGTGSKNIHMDLIYTILVGSLVGYIGYLTKIPAGGLSFAMVGVAALNIFLGKGFMPIKLRQLIQVLGGALIGARIGMEDILGMKTMLPAVGVIILGFILMNIAIGMLIFKMTKFNMATSLFSAAPGGLSDISIIASEMGADTPKVAVIQLMRMVSIVSFYPILIQMVARNW